MIVQGFDGEDNSTSISFTTSVKDLSHSLDVAKQISQKHKMRGVTGAKGIAKVTVSGIGLRSHTQVGTVLFKTLADAGINVQMINTSELQLNAVIEESSTDKALSLIKSAFATALSPKAK